MPTNHPGITARAPVTEIFRKRVLTPEAMEFLAALHQKFAGRRQEILQARVARIARFRSGELPGFSEATRSIREDDWKIAPVPHDLEDRRVEITGPAEPKMMINALNARVNAFMCDLEDSFAPTWSNFQAGHLALQDAVRRTLTFSAADRQYRLNEKTAVLMVRPRGWHLPEKHLTWNGTPMSGSLTDFGLYFFHNARELLARGTGPYFYLPKMESHLEARLWNDVFTFAQESLQIPHGTIKATVLIETLPAAFEMDEILYELRSHAAGLNAGRWDYIFSCIKCFAHDRTRILPDRAQVTMTVPFMQAYCELLVQTCHRRGAHAMGGMAAFIPSRRDPEVNRTALAKVRGDKERECALGFDGTWIAHPDLAAVAGEVFEKGMDGRPNQKQNPGPARKVAASDLIDFRVPAGKVTESGIRTNIDVALQYLGYWLDGTGAAAIHNLMEDAATAEISRAQLWQWQKHRVALEDGRPVTLDLIRSILMEETARLQSAAGKSYAKPSELFDSLISSEEIRDFLTIPAYELL